MAFDPSDMTLGEIEQVETIGRAPISALEDPKAPKGRLMSALALVMMRRDNPAAKLEDAQALSQREVLEMFKGSPGVDPT